MKAFTFIFVLLLTITCLDLGRGSLLLPFVYVNLFIYLFLSQVPGFPTLREDLLSLSARYELSFAILNLLIAGLRS